MLIYSSRPSLKKGPLKFEMELFLLNSRVMSLLNLRMFIFFRKSNKTYFYHLHVLRYFLLHQNVLLVKVSREIPFRLFIRNNWDEQKKSVSFYLLEITELATDLISLLWLLESMKWNLQDSANKILRAILGTIFTSNFVLLSPTLIHLLLWLTGKFQLYIFVNSC